MFVLAGRSVDHSIDLVNLVRPPPERLAPLGDRLHLLRSSRMSRPVRIGGPRHLRPPPTVVGIEPALVASCSTFSDGLRSDRIADCWPGRVAASWHHPSSARYHLPQYAEGRP